MSGNFKTVVIANPESGGGALKRRWPRTATTIRKNFGPFEHRFTSRPGHAAELTREALRDGFEQVVALGGDGTTSEVVNGFFEGGETVNPDAVFGLIPFGTGCDLRRTLGLTKEIAQCAAGLAGRSTTPMDVGRLHYTSHEGAQESRYFINIASFGMGGLVDKYVNQSGKTLGGTLSFFMATARAAVVYKNKAVEITLDDQEPYQMKVVNVAVANGQYFGGGMRVAPYARVDDGLLDTVAIGDFSPLEMLRFGYKIYLGSHLDHPRVRPDRARVVKARPVYPEDHVLLDVDGETPGRLPATFEILPGALNRKIPD